MIKTTQRIAYLSVILSGTLGFLIQPLMGKKLIPFFGGAPASWIGSLLFFQTALLLGYLWAFWLLKKSPKTQVLASSLLALTAILTFQSPEPLAHANPTILGVIWTLAKACLPACIALFSTTLLLSGWLAQNNQKIPYQVYAVSNLGSLTGLVGYAFFLEPNYPISFHTNLWLGMAIACFSSICLIGLITLKTARPQKAENSLPSPESEKIPWKQIAKWIGLSGLACSLMIASTYLLSGELGSNPISWTAPFGLYLAAFSLSFTGKIPLKHLPLLTCLALASFCLWEVAPKVNKQFGPALLLSTFSICLLLLTKLYHSQPKENYKAFLLCLAIGGSLGGLVSSFLIPLIFIKNDEFFYLSVLSLAIGLTSCTKTRTQAIGLAFILFLLPTIPPLYRKNETKPFPLHYRDSLGSLRVGLNGSIMAIDSLGTTHGSQDLKNPKTPTSYFSRHSPPGLYLTSQTKPLKVGIIGMSAGTLATYAKPEDTYTFWDIDPKIVPIAQSLFEYLKNSEGKIQIDLADGRLSLEKSQEDYDVLIVDAYSGDAIPPHLLTQEAFQTYKNRLENKNGVLFVHHTTRYSNYSPILTNTAHSLKMPSFTVETLPQAIDPYAARSVYTVFTTNPDKNPKTLLTLTENIHKPLEIQPKPEPVWTDEFNSALHPLQPSRALKKFLEF